MFKQCKMGIIFFLMMSSFRVFASYFYSNILFWPNMNMGFGHVAIEIFSDESKWPHYYISYAMGNRYAIDLQKHMMEPERIRLPEISKDNLNHFKEWYHSNKEISVPYSKEYGKKYHIVKNNCAHVVLKVMDKLGYPVRIKNRFILTPRKVRNEAYRVVKRNNRQNIYFNTGF